MMNSDITSIPAPHAAGTNSTPSVSSPTLPVTTDAAAVAPVAFSPLTFEVEHALMSGGGPPTIIGDEKIFVTQPLVSVKSEIKKIAACSAQMVDESDYYDNVNIIEGNKKLIWGLNSDTDSIIETEYGLGLFIFFIKLLRRKTFRQICVPII